MDPRLERRYIGPTKEKVTATPPVDCTKDDPLIVLDGSGRFVDLFATPDHPAYLTQPRLRIGNHPSRDRTAVTDKDTVSIEAKKDASTIKQPIEPGREICLQRAELHPFESDGFVKLDVKRLGQTIQTLWLILRNRNVVLIGEKGPLDPAFTLPTPASVTDKQVMFEYVSSNGANAPPLVLVSAKRESAADAAARRRALAASIGPRDQAPIAQPTEPAKQWVLTPNIDPPLTIDWNTLNTLRRPEDTYVELVLLKNGRAINVITLTQTPPNEFKPADYSEEPQPGSPNPPPSTSSTAQQPQPPTERRRVYEIMLDRLGIASPEYLNRRRPAYIAMDGAETFLRFNNLLTDRVFVVTFSGIPETERAELVRDGIQIANCRDGKCQASVRIAPTGHPELPVASLRNAYAVAKVRTAVTFQVSFFDDDTTPTNSRGYLTFVDADQFVEQGSTTTWSTAISATLAHEPDLSTVWLEGTKVPSITFATPWSRTNRTHVTGGASVNLKHVLGARADAEVELAVKKGDFGEDASVSPSKYFANVSALYGLTITGGRFDLAAPTNAIALSESGEAVNGAMRVPGIPWNVFANVGYIFKKEMAAGSFTADAVTKAITAGASSLDHHNGALVVQIRDIVKAGAPFRASGYLVRGHADRGRTFKAADAPKDAKPELVSFDADYWTVGTDAILSLGRTSLNAGLYHSKRTSDAPETVRRVSDALEGNVGLATLSYTNINHDGFVQGRQAADFVVSGSIGAGGAFAGESQSYTPDTLFLATFASALLEPTVPIGEGSIDKKVPIGGGLTNKWYYGVVVSTPKRGWLDAIATVLHFPKSDIGSVGSSLKLHHYRSRTPGASSAALGTEEDFELRVESPKGVRYQLTLAAFQPSSALKTPAPGHSLVSKFQYAIKFNVTVRFE